MQIKTAILLCSICIVTACGFGQSRLNPLNWFGASQAEAIEASAEAPEEINPLIPQRTGLFNRARAQQEIYLGVPVEQVTSLVIERVPGGALIRATGVAISRDVYDIRLTPENEDEMPVDGVLTYRLEGVITENAVPGGDTRLREVYAGRQLTEQELSQVRVIRVEGRTNAQVTRRR